jgi:hypothetical protein
MDVAAGQFLDFLDGAADVEKALVRDFCLSR